MMIDELDLLVGSGVSHAVVNQHVESVPLGPHVDEQGDGVANVNGPSDPVTIKAVARPDLHKTLWGS